LLHIRIIVHILLTNLSYLPVHIFLAVLLSYIYTVCSIQACNSYLIRHYLLKTYFSNSLFFLRQFPSTGDLWERFIIVRYTGKLNVVGLHSGDVYAPICECMER
jgi:hypothetical protein